MGGKPRRKICSVDTCKKAKPYSAFNKHRGQKDGHQPQCRDCSKAGKVQWRKDNAARVKRYETERDPQKQRARKLFRAALKRGDIERPDRCSRCKKVGPVEGHHPDYAKPLKVMWLCRIDHEKEHTETRLGARKITPKELKT